MRMEHLDGFEGPATLLVDGREIDLPRVEIHAWQEGECWRITGVAYRADGLAKLEGRHDVALRFRDRWTLAVVFTDADPAMERAHFEGTKALQPPGKD